LVLVKVSGPKGMMSASEIVGIADQKARKNMR